MTLLVTVETVLLILMLLLVAGLLRSHAEILRRLETSGGVRPTARGPEITPVREPGAPAFDVTGETLDGGSLGISVAGTTDTLIAFLSSGCLTCRGFWDALRDGTAGAPDNVRVVVATRDPGLESPSKLRELAPRDVPVIMTATAWDDYEVPMSPYFVFVDGATGTIAGEGTAQTWAQVMSLLRDAIADQDLDSALGGADQDPDSALGGAVGASRSGQRFVRADRELSAAGVGADHPSLYEPDDPALLDNRSTES